MSDTGVRALARKRAKAAEAGRKVKRPAGAAIPFDRSLAHLCWQLGLSHERTAWVMRRSVGEVRHEWSVLTGLPLDDDPTEAEVERITAEIRAGWTPEVFSAAARGIRHQSDRMHRGISDGNGNDRYGRVRCTFAGERSSPETTARSR